MTIIKYKNIKGFTLLEMLISIMIITLGVISIFTAVIKYTQYTQQIENNLTASYLAQEGIEIVKNIRDSNWTTGNDWDANLAKIGCDTSGCEADYSADYSDNPLVAWSGSGRFLYIEGGNGFYKYITTPQPDDIKTPFKRKITITSIGSDELDLKVEVFWNGITSTVKENIYNWKP